VFRARELTRHKTMTRAQNGRVDNTGGSRDGAPDEAPLQVDEILRRSPVGIAVIDGDGLYRSVNPAYCALYGYPEPELLGRSFTHVFPPPQRERMLALHRAFLAEGGELHGERDVVRRDGVHLSVISESVRFPTGNGRACRLVYVLDITPLKQAQASLRQQQDLLLDLAASLPGAMVRLIIRANRDWQFVYANPGIEPLFGITPALALSDKRALRRCVLAEDLPALDAALGAAIARRRGWEHEFRIRTPGGALKWVHARAQPKPGSEGDVVWSGMLTDVSERKRIEARLKASEETYRTLFETVPQGVVYHDARGRITSANPAAQRILGLSHEELLGRTPTDPLWHAIQEDGSALPGEQHPVTVALRTGRPVKEVVLGLQAPGRGLVWILVSATPLHRKGRLSELYASFEDITERVLLSQQLRHQASTDPLTGAANRRSLMARLQVEYERVRRHPEHACSVLAIDLDHFKHVNDRLGHAAGDALLVHVTQLMRQESRQVDVLGRTGGEEFALVLPDTGADEALALAERLRRRIAETPLVHTGHTIGVTVSIGISVIARADASFDAVLLRADRALYAAKDAGRNTVLTAAAPA
jgi:diguanylate cyclase (GGDEF)-like protein/PAS domain S-box-containing protein